MKHCPKCNRTFPDDTKFCLTDGAELISDAPDVDLMKTVVWTPPRSSDAPPRPSPAPSIANYERPSVPSVPGATPATGSTKKAAKASIILGIINLVLTLVLGTTGGIGSLARAVYRLILGLRLSLELLALVILILLPLISIVFGVIGLIQAFRQPARYGGEIIAAVGIILSLFSGLIFILWIFYWMLHFFPV